MSKTTSEIQKEIDLLEERIEKAREIADRFGKKLTILQKELEEAKLKEDDPFSFKAEKQSTYVYWINSHGWLNVHSKNFEEGPIDDETRWYNELENMKKNLGLVWFSELDAKQDLEAIKFRMVLRYFKRKYDTPNKEKNLYCIAVDPSKSYGHSYEVIFVPSDLDTVRFQTINSITFNNREAAERCAEYLNSHDLQVV